MTAPAMFRHTEAMDASEAPLTIAPSRLADEMGRHGGDGFAASGVQS